MAMANLTIHQPQSLTEALELVSAHRASVKLLAGGTDLLPKMKAGVLDVPHLVSLRRVAGLDTLEFSPEQGLTIGAQVRISTVGDMPEAAEHYPGLAHACSVMATTQIRNMGTITGNLVNAAPSADTAAPLLAYGASLVAQGPDGIREIKLDEFFTGPGMHVLEPMEIVTAIKLPAPPARSGSCYQRISARSLVDIAAVGVAGLMALDEDGKVADCRLALASVAPIPLRCPEAEQMLIGQKPVEALFARAAQSCRQTAKPIDDVRASAAYRLAMVGVLSQRVLEQSLRRAQGGA
jgi:carbon-monoxide dehydrogenase medium subunit